MSGAVSACNRTVRPGQKALAESGGDSGSASQRALRRRTYWMPLVRGMFCCPLMDLARKASGGALHSWRAVVDPDAIVIGGGVSEAGQPLINLIEKHYKNTHSRKILLS